MKHQEVLSYLPKVPLRSKTTLYWLALSTLLSKPHIYALNWHELNPSSIPDTLWMMVHLKLLFPLLMLTTDSLAWIQFNNNLKFKKVPFCHAARKYALNEAHFPTEDSLTDAEYFQVHKYWLMLIKIMVEASMYNGWRAHHDRMSDNLDLLKWSHAWWPHDKQFHSLFIDKSFIMTLT